MHNIALIGFGTVGQGLADILAKKREELLNNYGYKFKIVAVSDLVGGNAYNPDGLDIERLLDEGGRKVPFTVDTTGWNTEELIRKSNATVICEMTYTDLKTAEPALSHCRAALASGKHVVTSNKGPAALAYKELREQADAAGLEFLIEGTVMSGTPVLNLCDGPLAGSEIRSARGILNGTTNYILSEMEEGAAYEDVLKAAQDLGYAEADPSGDVEGYDARAKVAILANVVMGIPLAIDRISCQGITRISSAQIEEARSKKSRWKLIGSVRRDGDAVFASVAPEMVELSHPLAGVMGATNALTLETDLLGEVTIVGPGAGRDETGFSILTDLLKIHRLQRASA